MLLERDGDTIILDVTLQQKDDAKSVPGARWDKDARRWRYPLSWATCVVARGVFGAELAIGDQLREWAKEERQRVDLTLGLRAATDAPGNDKLFPFQRADVLFYNMADSVLDSSEMGTGKTPKPIVSISEKGSTPALVVCPSSVKRHWARLFRVWAPELRVQVAKSGQAGGRDAAAEIVNGAADVLILGWEALRALSRPAAYGSIRIEGCSNCDPNSKRRPSSCQREPKVLNSIAWGAVIADEAHRAKNPTALQTRCLWSVADRADRRIALTGTPIANSAADLWSVMRFVAPDEYPTRANWIDRYAQLEANIWSGGVDVVGLRPDRRPELDAYFLPRFIRRLKSDVLPDLPPKLYERRDIELSGKQRKAYDQMEEEMLAGIEGGTIAATNMLTVSLRLRQLASAYGEIVSTIDWGSLSMDDHDRLFRAIDQQVKLAEPSTKLDELEAVLEDLGEKQAVIFAESSQLIRLAAARLESECIIDGEVSPEDRDRNLDAFIKGDQRVILLTVGAGGEGLDGLQAADTAIFLQRPWSAVLNKQAEDRLHRIGSAGSAVTYIDIVATGTIEERVFDSLRKKGRRLQDVVRDDEE